MPLPNPHKKEKRSEFVSRCMSNTHIQNDFDTQEQKVAVCYSLFKKKTKKAAFAVETDSDQTNYYTILPEDEDNYKNPLDHDSDNQDRPENPQISPDKWPSQAPKALDDTPGLKPDLKASDFKRSDDYKKSDQSHPPASFPSLSPPGINTNPDNSKNFPIKSGGNWEKPQLKDQKWFLAIEEAIPDDNIENMKEWYINAIDKMPYSQENANWPLSFDKIEKDFDRPNKINTLEVKLKNKQSEENRDSDKVAREDKPYVI